MVKRIIAVALLVVLAGGVMTPNAFAQVRDRRPVVG